MVQSTSLDGYRYTKQAPFPGVSDPQLAAVAGEPAPETKPIEAVAPPEPVLVPETEALAAKPASKPALKTKN